MDSQCILAAGAGGFLGSISRYIISCLMKQWEQFPCATLSVNALGGLMIGIISSLLPKDAAIMRSLVITGFLGGFTTFSTFSLETVSLFEKGETVKGFLNIFLNISIAIAFAYIGSKTPLLLRKI